MEANCQEFFRHRVPSSKKVTSPRFSLSFRRVLTPSVVSETVSEAVLCEAATSPIKEQIKFYESMTQTSPAKSPTPSIAPVPVFAPTIAPGTDSFGYCKACNPLPERRDQPPIPRDSSTRSHDRDITVLFGTSITRWLDCESLSDDRNEFMNVSVSGARIKNTKHFHRIPDMGTMLENFASVNLEKAERVKTVVFSLGTNDIIKLFRKDMGPGFRAKPGDMSVFYQPLSNLVKSARYFFGREVKIVFQSVIPMKVMYTYTARNFLNFNNLLRSVCHDFSCGYLDIFDYFLDSEGNDFNDNIYADPFHLNKGGISVLEGLLKSVFKEEPDSRTAPGARYNYF